MRPPARPISDDEILRWWEAFDAGMEIPQIARAFRRTAGKVREELTELGVLEPDPALLPAHEEALATQDFTPSDLRIMAALAKLEPDFAKDNEVRGGIPFARSLDHVFANKRAACVMSERQRGQDRLASGVIRKVIRADLRRAGLISRGRAG